MKCIFLDFNGTVLDDVDLCLDLLNTMLEAKGKASVDILKYKSIFTFPIRKYYEKAGFTYENYSFEELADWFIIEYTKRNVKECSIFNDVREFINLMHQKGYYVILCSASKLNLLIDQLISFGIRDFFDDVIGLSNHHAASKLSLALEYNQEHNVTVDESYFIGDTTHDFEVGMAMGTKVILVNRGHQNTSILKATGSPVVSSLLETLEYIK